MRLALMGTRGIPARYGGFETFAEELSARLARRGHEVTVYCRRHYSPHPQPDYRGVRRVILPAFPHKYLDTVSHSALSALHGLFAGYDAVLMCNAINALFTLLPRLAAQKVAINVDGIERQRRKWNWLGRAAYLISERLAARLPHVLVADARVIQHYYRQRYGVESVLIPYGAALISEPAGEMLKKLNLISRSYFLYVSRLEPENHAHTVIQAYQKLIDAPPLVVVGDAPYSQNYIAGLKKLAESSARGKRVILTGSIYGKGVEELLSHALAYVQATEVGGTHPALLQAMGAGNIIIANDTPEHREVLEDTGIYYQRNHAADLTARLAEILRCPDKFERLRVAARQRVAAHYSWETTTDLYERLFQNLRER
ncbi:MAG TPA: glycosyltransferase [Acidobacteriota bacterium]|jgi:glycosyltransferase involved in cell wall biosynthesis